MTVLINGTTGVDIGAGTLTFPDDTTQTSSPIGVGQTWQNVTSSRAAGTTYTNNTGKPIQILPTVSGSNYYVVDYYINSIKVMTLNSGGAGYSQIGATPLIIPNGNTYSITITVGTLGTWFELR